MASAIHNAIAAKTRILREEYGGMLSLKQLTRELGLKDTRAAKAWAEEHGIGNQIGPRVRYDADQIAKALVMGRGMVSYG